MAIFYRSADGIYTIDSQNMYLAIESLTQLILKIQGDGDYDAAVTLTEKYGYISDELQIDLEKINQNKIPVDIVFNQEPKKVGL